MVLHWRSLLVVALLRWWTTVALLLVVALVVALAIAVDASVFCPWMVLRKLWIWVWWLLLRTGAIQLRRRRQRIIWLLLRWVLQSSCNYSITQYSIHVIPSVSRSRPCCEGVVVGYVADCDSPLLCLWRVLWASLLVVALACHFDCSCSMRDGGGCSVKGAGEVLDF